MGESMRKYGSQVWLYSSYFFKVMLDNVGVMLYTVGLPIFFLALNLKSAMFKPLTLSQYTGKVLPFVAWIIFSNTIVMVGEVALLREQGYLKQYVSLVVNPSVFILSKAIVNLGLLLVILALVAGGSAVMFQLPFWALLWRLWGVLIMVSIPMWGYGLPLLSFEWRYQTVTAVMNVLTLAVMLGSVAVGNWLNIKVSNPVASVLSPVYLVMACFDLLVTGHWATFLPAYLSALIGLSLVGMLSYRQLKLLPTEGV